MSCTGGVLTLSCSGDEADMKNKLFHPPPLKEQDAHDISDDDDDDDDDIEEEDKEDGTAMFQRRAKKPMGGGVRFGSVRVHKHKLTLGDNPSAHTFGPPLTLDWDVTESQRFANIDEYCMEYHGVRDSLRHHEAAHVIQGAMRQAIAAQDHSAGSIRKLQAEIYQIRQERKKSAVEDPSRLKEDSKKVSAKKGGFLRGLFHK